MKFLARMFDDLHLDNGTRSYIAQQLASPHRHYHTAHHLSLMMRHLAHTFDTYALGTDERLFALHQWDSWVIATLFHDIVYDPLRSDNEEQSAFEMRMRMPPNPSIDLAEKMILATRSHKLLSGNDEESRAINYFLRADLSILWSFNPHTYEWYARGVRKEYSHVPNADYRIGLAKLITKLKEDI